MEKRKERNKNVIREDENEGGCCGEGVG